MRFILIRHYKTEFNVSGRVIGWGDSPRAPDWLEDIVSVERILRQHDLHPDVICSSALERARHTADYFATRFHAGSTQAAPELNEINYGSLYGKSKKWVAQQYPGHKKDADFVYPDGESFNQLQARAVAQIQSLARTHRGQTVLCVAHAGVIRALICHFLDLEYVAHLKCKVSHRYIGVLDFCGPDCAVYDEWGKPSGFVSEGTVVLPYTRKSA